MYVYIYIYIYIYRCNTSRSLVARLKGLKLKTTLMVRDRCVFIYTT